MRIVCRHGHYAFYPFKSEEIANFCTKYDASLSPENDYYTFDELIDAPRYSIQGKPWLDIPALETFEGPRAWDVMQANDFVFSLQLKTIVPKLSIVGVYDNPRSAYYWRAVTILPQAGYRDVTGQQILSFDAIHDVALSETRILSVSYE